MEAQCGAAATLAPACLPTLPPDLLEDIAEPLETKDRVAFFSTCRALAQVDRVSTQLWRDVAARIGGGKEGSLGMWLHRRRHQLGRLRLDFACKSGCIRAVMDPLAGSCVRCLKLDVGQLDRGAAQLGGWLACLPQLESLEVECGQLAITPCFSQLTTLTRLDMGAAGCEGGIFAAPGCLPTSLVALGAAGLAANPLAVPLPALRELSACWRYKEEEGETLSRLDMLPGLTSLDLNNVDLLATPRQISALTALQRLSLTLDLFGEVPDADGAAFFEPLLPLRQLSHLFLMGCTSTIVPAGMLVLPELKELDLTFFNSPACPVSLSAASALERLTLPVAMAAGSVEQLAALQHLRSFQLTGPHPLLPALNANVLDVQSVIESVASLPRLERVTVVGMHGDLLAGACEALAALQQRRPGLAIEGPKLR